MEIVVDTYEIGPDPFQKIIKIYKLRNAAPGINQDDFERIRAIIKQTNNITRSTIPNISDCE